MILNTALLLGFAGLFGPRPAAAASPPGNTVQQWNEIAENTVVASGAFQNEGLIYMGYVSAPVYNSAAAIGGGYASLGAGVRAPRGASLDAAVIEAAYDTLANYFPAQSAPLYAAYTEALSQLPNDISKSNGQAVGLAAATALILSRTGDGRLTPTSWGGRDNAATLSGKQATPVVQFRSHPFPWANPSSSATRP